LQSRLPADDGDGPPAAGSAAEEAMVAKFASAYESRTSTHWWRC